MQDEAVGPDNIPGFDKVEALANYLLRFRQESGVISQSQAGKIVELWNALHSFDRTVSRKQHHQPKLTKGRFKPSRGTNVIPGVDSTRRYAKLQCCFT